MASLKKTWLAAGAIGLVVAMAGAGAIPASAATSADEEITFTVLGHVDAGIGDEVGLEQLESVDVTAEELEEVGVEIADDGELSLDLTAQEEPIATAKAAHGSFNVTRAAVRRASVSPRTGTYDVIASWRAKDGNTVTLRRAAYDKIVTKHNLTTAVVKRVTTSYSSRLGAGSATAFNYFLEAKQITCNVLTCWVSNSLWVQSTVDYRAISGGTFGVVTTYCQGVTLCPNWVKNALNV